MQHCVKFAQPKYVHFFVLFFLDFGGTGGFACHRYAATIWTVHLQTEPRASASGFVGQLVKLRADGIGAL
jgi:hypothetical protein